MATDHTGVAARRRDDLAVLVAAAGDGDRHAWDLLLHRLMPMTWRVCRAYELTAPEAGWTCNLVWLRFVDWLATESVSRNATGWIFDTTVRECRTVRALVSRPDRVHATGDDVDARMERAYDTLSVRDRLLLTLLADGAFSYREVGDMLGMPLGSIGPTRRRCLQRLRRMAETRT